MAHRFSGGEANSAAKTLALLGLVLLAALGIRLYVASRAAMISRDGANFIWYAQALARDPLAEMRAQRQHPLYPAMVLGAHRVVTTVGKAVPNSPALNDPVLSWETAGMSVTLLGGLAAVLGVYALARALFERNVETSKRRKVETAAAVSYQLSAISQKSCQFPVAGCQSLPQSLDLSIPPSQFAPPPLKRWANLAGEARAVALIAALLAALAAEFCQLSADVLTDMPHLALYLFALAFGITGLRRRSYARLIGSGALSGIAFLIRPEGAEPAVVVVAVALVGTRWPLAVRLKACVAVAVAGLAFAGPYMLITGKLVQKKAIGQLVGNVETSKRRNVEIEEGLGVRGRGLGTRGEGRGARDEGRNIACRRHAVTIAQHFSAGSSSSADKSLCRPVGTVEAFGRAYGTSFSLGVSGVPALKGWAILDRAYGTQSSPAEALACIAGPEIDARGCVRSGGSPRFALGASYGLAGGDVVAPVRAVGIVAEHWVRCLRVTLLVPAIVWLVLRRLRGRRGGAASPVPELGAEGTGGRLRPPGGGAPPALHDSPFSPFAPVHIGLRVLGAAMTLHVAIAVLLIIRFDYWELFSMRHVVVLAAMTLPISAAGVLAIIERVGRRRRLVLAGLIAVLILPTSKWMLEARYADEAYLRRAGEWIRSQSPASAQARVLTTRNQVALYAGGTLVWGPLDADFTRYLAEAREKRPGWLVFDERRLLKMSPTFFADLLQSARPGELVEAVRMEQRSRRGVECAVVYRYNP